MSDWDKNHETASKLLNIVQAFKQPTPSIGMIQFQRLIKASKIIKLSEDSQYDEISLLSRRVHELERRLDKFESVLDIPPLAGAELLIKKVFSEIPTIKKIYTKPTQSGLLLIMIHGSKTISDAIGRIQPGLDRLEDEFPDLYFDPWILRPNEVHDEHLQQSKLIFERYND